jgi:type VI secretion system secreted protein Hcp
MAFDAFLKLDGIDGESQDDKHKNEIDLISFNFGAQQPQSAATGGGLGAGKVHMSDLTVTKHIDKASPKLLLACCTGQHIKTASLTARKAGGGQQDYMVVKLTDVIVSGYHGAGEAQNGNTLPSEQVALNYSKIEYEYKQQNADGTLGGTVAAGYDVKANKKV